MRNTKPEVLAISTIVYGEVSEGVFFSETPSENRRVWYSLLRGLEVIDVTREIAEAWAYVRGALRRGGLTTGDNDLMIAATALVHDMTVVTRNLADFSRVPGLSLMTVARPRRRPRG